MENPKIRFKGFTKDWEQRKLKEIADKVSEKNKNNEFSEPFTNSAEQGIISQKDYFDREIVNNENLDSYYIVRNDDFIYNPRISVMAPVGPINRNRLGRNGVMSPLYTVFRTHDIDNLYLEFYFKTTKWHRFMKLNGDSGARFDRFTISSTQFMEMPIPYPMLDEQRKIGEYFDSLDNLITLHQRKCEQTKKLKKYMLQKMFPQNGAKVPEIRFYGFTYDWEQRKLGDVCSRVQGNDGRMKLPTLTISAGNGWMRQEDRFSGNIAGNEQKNYTLLHTGELSYNHGNSKLAKYGAVFSLRNYEEALVPRVYHSFRVEEGCADYIEYYFATKLPDRELRKLISSGARMDGLLNIGYDEFMGIKMMFPSIKEQNEIATYFRSLDHLITLHQRKCDELKKMKKYMLQNMFI